MTYTLTPAQSEALKNGATQLRVALDPQPDEHAPIRESVEFEPNVWVFLNGYDGSIVERAALPLATGDTFPVGDKTATVIAVRVERLQDVDSHGLKAMGLATFLNWNATAAPGQMFEDNPWVAVATVEMKGE